MERGGEREKEGRDERKKTGRKVLFMDYIMHLSDCSRRFSHISH